MDGRRGIPGLPCFRHDIVLIAHPAIPDPDSNLFVSTLWRFGIIVKCKISFYLTVAVNYLDFLEMVLKLFLKSFHTISGYFIGFTLKHYLLTGEFIVPSSVFFCLHPVFITDFH